MPYDPWLADRRDKDVIAPPRKTNGNRLASTPAASPRDIMITAKTTPIADTGEDVYPSLAGNIASKDGPECVESVVVDVNIYLYVYALSRATVRHDKCTIML